MYSIHRDTPSFIIDSDDRIDGSISYFSANVNMKPNNNYDMVSLIHAGIPKTYYNIDDSNCILTLRENSVDHDIPLLNGEYTTTNLPAIIQDELNLTSLFFNPATPWTYVITWNDFTKKWKFEVTGHAGRPVLADSGLKFSNDQTYKILGFEDNTTNLFVTDILHSTIIPNFERTLYFSIKSNLCNNAGNSDPDSSVLARIPVDNYDFNDYIVYDVIQLADSVKNITSNKSNVYIFGLYDDRDRLINLNGRGWYFTLFMYEHNTLPMRELQLLDRQKEQEERQQEANNIANAGASMDIQDPQPKIIDIIDEYDVENNAIYAKNN